MSSTNLDLGGDGRTSDIWSNTGPVRIDIFRQFSFPMPHSYRGPDLGCRAIQDSDGHNDPTEKFAN